MSKKTKKIAIIVAVVVFVVTAAIGIGMLVSSKGNTSGDLSDLDLGNTYLDELQYDQALAFFEGIIEIEPKNVEAYLGVVEVYIRTGEFEKALEYAKKGYKATGDARLQEKIDMLDEGNITASNGWTMREAKYDAEGKLIWWRDFEYNDIGKKSKVTAYDATGAQLGELDLVYNEQGKQLVGYTVFNTSGKIAREEYTYEGDLKTKTIRYEVDGVTVNQIITYVYDERGEEIRVDYDYADASKEDYYNLYEYNEQGKVSMNSSYTAGGKLRHYYLYKYDENGNRILTETYDENGALTKKTVVEYDKDGNKIGSKNYDGNGNLQSETKNEK